tara:strand:+ start:336 stop:617 length:282 start_codon:yes stop_codon:yes gene_type:complete
MNNLNFEQRVDALISDLGENIQNIYRFEDDLDWVNVDIHFINPVTGSLDEVSLFADNGDQPSSMLYCPDIGNGFSSGVVVDTLEDLYNTILED